MSNYANLTDIRAEKVNRAATGFQELDWMYGYTTIGNKTYWGIPCSKISLWSGISGVGKSRIAVELAKSLAGLGFKILYFQSEESLPSFAAKIKSGYTEGKGKFLCSDSTDLDSQIAAIWEVYPDFIFVDSINEMEDYRYGTKGDIKKIFHAYREVTRNYKCHIIFLTQLNQDGTIKGSTTLPHLADIALKLVPCDKEGSSLFEIRMGIKHRLGRRSRNIYSRWQHTETGVNCISDYSLEDEIWCRTHNISVRDMKKYYENLGTGAPQAQTIKISQDFSQEEEVPKYSIWGDLSTLLFGQRKNL